MTSSPALPADRGHLTTEQRHDRSHDLDALDVNACVALMTDDHAAALEALRGARATLTAFIEDLVPRVRAGGRLVYLGAGTSGRLGVLDASECPPTFQSEPGQVMGVIAGGDPALRHSSEGREDDPDGAADVLAALDLGAGDTLLGIAAGGTTPYVLGALRHAAARGAATGLLTCAQMHTPPPHCDRLIVLDTGPELVTGSTRLKAGTATKLALNTITTVLFVQLGKVYSNLMVDLRATNDKLRDRAIRILRELCPDLPRDAAATALVEAGDALKTAVVMQRCGVDRETAEARLDAAGGRLRGALEAAG